MALSWGDVPTWLALIGVVVGVLTYSSARRDASRSSATQVYVVVTSFCYGTDPENADHHLTACVRNDASTPVFDLGVSLWEWGDRRITWRTRRHSRWMTSERLTGRHYITLLPGTSTTEEEWPPVVNGSLRRDASLLPRFLLVFRDGNGRRWIRWPDGRLTRLAPSVRMFKN